jgi:hypothetical protein
VRRAGIALAQSPGRTRRACAVVALACVVAPWPAGFAADAKPKKPAASALSAAEIVAKNVAARGGLEAWRKIETMVWTGHLESTHTPAPSMPFLLDQKRPNKTRFELHAMTDHSVRVFDGTQGWKSHSGADGRPTVKPYTAEEIRYARAEQAVDGPLIDLEAKGTTAALAGVEQLEGRKVYHLSLRLASAERQDVWVDAKTFLDVKVVRIAYGANGVPGVVPTLYRDFKPFEGLQIPTTIQIGDGSTGTPDRMQIERIALNLPLDDRLFAKPGTTSRRNAGGPVQQPAPVPDAPPLYAPRSPAPPAAANVGPDR